jgi:hypothetical protein
MQTFARQRKIQNKGTTGEAMEVRVAAMGILVPSK